MGVPGFFAWLLKKYKNSKIITSIIQDRINTLYIDANCLFHPQCHKVLDFYGNKLSVSSLENKMIERILEYIDFLKEFVNPTDAIFIAVDGVAPLSKMNQQRKRRFRSVADNKLRNDIKKKHNRPVATIWNNTVITPGTDFMEKLHKAIIQHINKYKITCVYSSYHVIGEGEHKILQDIKKSNKSQTYGIYGLDADLIFLALASNKNKIYLVREDTFFNDKNIEKEYSDIREELNYVSIDETKACINDHIITSLNINTNRDFTHDFTVLCYFLGNDFIPNIPSIDIKNDGMNFLLDQYVSTYNQLNNGFISNSNINMDFLTLYLNNLAKYEDYYFKVRLPNYFERCSKRQCASIDLYDVDIWNMENMKMFDCDDPILLGFDESQLWKFRFYEHYYGVSEYQTEHVNQMCHNYMEGIFWTFKYYFQKCDSYLWFYEYYHAPFVSDLANYLNNNKINIVFPQKQLTITPYTQLLAVLPTECSNLLPSKYADLMHNIRSPIIDLFPKSVSLDMLYKDSYHKCITLVPNIDIERIINAIKKIKLSVKDQEKNSMTDNLITVNK